MPKRVLRILDPILTLNIQTPQVPGEITLNWTNFVTGEDGWRVERSTDVVNFNWRRNLQIGHDGRAKIGEAHRRIGLPGPAGGVERAAPCGHACGFERASS